MNRKINEVFLDQRGVIHAVYHGLQTADKLQRTLERTMKIMGILKKSDRPVRLLADIRDMSSYDQPAKLVEMHARSILPFWKMALVSKNDDAEGEKISRQLTRMSGRKGETRYFRREDDAVGWLSFMR